MKIKEITDLIESFAPLSLQENYDNAGLLTGNKENEARGALFCVDVTEEVVDEALELGVNMIISHHPIIFSPLKKINGGNHIERIVIKAIKNDVAIYAAHTNLDSAAGLGLSHKMAEMLGLRDIEVLEPRNDGSGTGYGAVGTLPYAEKSGDFLLRLKGTFNAEVVRHSRIHKPEVRKIAVCSGSGSFMMDAAANAGADVFITSDVRYNSFFDADNRLILADIGHFESEYCAIDTLYGIVTKKFPKFAVHKSVNSKNPIIYL